MNMITRYPVVKLHVSDYVSNSIWTEKRAIWQTDKHQGRQSRIYTRLQVALNPHRMKHFLVRPNESAQLLKVTVALLPN